MPATGATGRYVNPDGEFTRDQRYLTDRITADGRGGETGMGGLGNRTARGAGRPTAARRPRTLPTGSRRQDRRHRTTAARVA